MVPNPPVCGLDKWHRSVCRPDLPWTWPVGVILCISLTLHATQPHTFDLAMCQLDPMHWIQLYKIQVLWITWCHAPSSGHGPPLPSSLTVHQSSLAFRATFPVYRARSRNSAAAGEQQLILPPSLLPNFRTNGELCRPDDKTPWAGFGLQPRGRAPLVWAILEGSLMWNCFLFIPFPLMVSMLTKSSQNAVIPYPQPSTPVCILPL